MLQKQKIITCLLDGMAVFYSFRLYMNCHCHCDCCVSSI